MSGTDSRIGSPTSARLSSGPSAGVLTRGVVTALRPVPDSERPVCPPTKYLAESRPRDPARASNDWLRDGMPRPVEGSLLPTGPPTTPKNLGESRPREPACSDASREGLPLPKPTPAAAAAAAAASPRTPPCCDRSLGAPSAELPGAPEARCSINSRSER